MILPWLLTVLAGSAWAGPKVVNRCLRGKCPVNGWRIAQRLSRTMNETIFLYDARPVKEIGGYWHLAMRESTPDGPGPLVFFTTDGSYALPGLIRVTSARRLEPAPAGSLPPTDVLLEERDGMYIGRPALEAMIPLIQRKKDDEYLVVMDSLWNDDLVKVLRALKGRKCYRVSVYLLPTFGMFSSKSLELGRHFHAMTSLGVPAVEAAAALSNLGQEWKVQPGALMELGAGMVKKAGKAENPDKAYRRALEKFSAKAVWKKTVDRMRKSGIAVMVPKGFIINDRFYYHPAYLFGKAGDPAKVVGHLRCGE